MKLKFFTIDEFDCQETGENNMEPEFLAKVDALRGACRFPFIVTSGFRHPTKHPIEKAKSIPGTHAQGIACDIRVTTGPERYTLVSEALNLGFTGIGVAKGFIHVDTRGTTPVVWLY
tara:strand:- start:964 stop:1314 length:351 start_codon:yes stop_codon:yes gene_type:complete